MLMIWIYPKQHPFMKNTLLLPLLVATMLFSNGCSSKKDSTEAAKDANDTKVDNEATATMSDSKTDAKDVTDYMVDLANAGRTEYEMSKVAEKSAANAAIMAYAAETVKEHSKDEAELNTEAKKRNITLPTALSNYNAELLKDLKGTRVGGDFDRRYLDHMSDVNKKAIDRAGSLINNTTDAELKTFVQKVVRDDQKHLDKATELRKLIKQE
jgi:putative membrane protein